MANNDPDYSYWHRTRDPKPNSAPSWESEQRERASTEWPARPPPASSLPGWRHKPPSAGTPETLDKLDKPSKRL